MLVKLIDGEPLPEPMADAYPRGDGAQDRGGGDWFFALIAAFVIPGMRRAQHATPDTNQAGDHASLITQLTVHATNAAPRTISSIRQSCCFPCGSVMRG